jgi:2-hydroxychromene-2-carboxylate isomerase
VGEPRATFLYDFNSPYAHLAAHRVDAVLGPGVRWQPIAFAFLLRAQGRTPWSMGDGRDAGMRECERRAAEYGLPPLRWPPDWPVGSYSLLPLRAALVAEEEGRLREFSLAAYAENFAKGRGVRAREAVADAARAADLDPGALLARAEGDEVKERLRAATDAAIAAGAPGVPTVLVGGEHFWGDDCLEDAAARLRRLRVANNRG